MVSAQMQKWFSTAKQYKENVISMVFRVVKRQAKKTQYLPAHERKSRIKTRALKQIKGVGGKKAQEQRIESLADITRNFFRQYFGIRYAFTNEELADELERRRIDPYIKKKSKFLLERLTETRYNVDHSDEEVQTLVNDVEEVVRLID